MKLSILIATLGSRRSQFSYLIDWLMPQVDKYNGQIEVIAYWNNGEYTIGDIRQQLIEESKGEYVCFIDDDDMVPSYYCDKIMANLGADYVGFKVKLFNDLREMPPVYHSLRYPTWYSDDIGYYRDITHLNPIRRALAVQAKFSGGMGEDEAWANAIRPLVKTENYIDDFMYYYHDSDKSSFCNALLNKQPQTRYPVESNNFRYHPNSKTIYKGEV